MTHLLPRSLLAVSLALAPVIGVVGLRLGADRVHTSAVRIGRPTLAVTLLMGERDRSWKIDLDAMQPMDQYWFAFEESEEVLRSIAEDLASGDHPLGARYVACMSIGGEAELEHALDDEVHLCVGAEADDLGVPPCAMSDWTGQGGRLVLLSVAGQHTRLDPAKLINSCREYAHYWGEWSQRQ